MAHSGVLRHFALQLLPSLIATYLTALSLKQRDATAQLETVFLAVYNEEITIGSGDTIAKKRDVVRIPSVRYPSIYHDPSKMSLPEYALSRYGTPTPVQVKDRGRAM